MREPVADIDDEGDEEHEHRQRDRDEHQDAAPFLPRKR